MQYIHVSPCIVYYSLLKSIDLTNREKAFKYLATSSLFEGGQVPPVVVIYVVALVLKSYDISFVPVFEFNFLSFPIK